MFKNVTAQTPNSCYFLCPCTFSNGESALCCNWKVTRCRGPWLLVMSLHLALGMQTMHLFSKFHSNGVPFFPQVFWFGSLSSLGQQFSLLQVWTHPSMRVFNQGEVQMLNNNCDAKAVCIPFRNYVFSFWNSCRISLPWNLPIRFRYILSRWSQRGSSL